MTHAETIFLRQLELTEHQLAVAVRRCAVPDLRHDLSNRLDLATPSGFDPLDRSVLRAVHDAEPFPPFPIALSLDTLTVRIEFELNPEGQDANLQQGN